MQGKALLCCSNHDTQVIASVTRPRLGRTPTPYQSPLTRWVPVLQQPRVQHSLTPMPIPHKKRRDSPSYRPPSFQSVAHLQPVLYRRVQLLRRPDAPLHAALLQRQEAQLMQLLQRLHGGQSQRGPGGSGCERAHSGGRAGNHNAQASWEGRCRGEQHPRHQELRFELCSNSRGSCSSILGCLARLPHHRPDNHNTTHQVTNTTHQPPPPPPTTTTPISHQPHPPGRIGPCWSTAAAPRWR